MTLPTRLTYEKTTNAFELLDADAPEESSGLGSVDREDVAMEMCERWNAVSLIRQSTVTIYDDAQFHQRVEAWEKEQAKG